MYVIFVKPTGKKNSSPRWELNPRLEVSYTVFLTDKPPSHHLCYCKSTTDHGIIIFKEFSARYPLTIYPSHLVMVQFIVVYSYLKMFSHFTIQIPYNQLLLYCFPGLWSSTPANNVSFFLAVAHFLRANWLRPTRLSGKLSSTFHTPPKFLSKGGGANAIAKLLPNCFWMFFRSGIQNKRKNVIQRRPRWMTLCGAKFWAGIQNFGYEEGKFERFSVKNGWDAVDCFQWWIIAIILDEWLRPKKSSLNILKLSKFHENNFNIFPWNQNSYKTIQLFDTIFARKYAERYQYLSCGLNEA